MATKYVTLKDSNGDTLYPQAVATNLAPGSIGTSLIADDAVEEAKIGDTVRKVRPYSMFLGNNPTNNYWKKLGNLKFTSHQQGKSVWLRILVGFGNNGGAAQNAYVDLIGQLGWTGSYGGRAGWSAVLNAMNTGKTTSSLSFKIIANSATDYDIWLKATAQYTAVTVVCIPGMQNFAGYDTTWTPTPADVSPWTATEPSGTACSVSFQSITPTS